MKVSARPWIILMLSRTYGLASWNVLEKYVLARLVDRPKERRSPVKILEGLFLFSLASTYVVRTDKSVGQSK